MFRRCEHHCGRSFYGFVHSLVCVLSVFNGEFPFQPCIRTNSRVRTAYTLRPPSMGRQCPNTTDKEPCDLNFNCFNYFYNITGTGNAMVHCLHGVAVVTSDLAESQSQSPFSLQRGLKQFVFDVCLLKTTVLYVPCVLDGA